MMMMNLNEIPPCYRFSPSDEEIITYYLRPKVEGEDMTWFSSVISEEDLYEAPPWVIFQNQQQASSSSSSKPIVGNGDHIRYFYTRLKKMHETGKKIHRTVGKNAEYCWDGQVKGKDIYDDRTMTLIGMKKQYSLIRSNQKKGGGGANTNSNNKKRKKSSSKDIHEDDDTNSNNKKRKKSSSSKDIHEDEDDDGKDESFGNWIMHEYSLINPPSTSSSKNNQNYVLCRIRMKSPPKPTTTGNAATHDHNSINSTTAPTQAPAPAQAQAPAPAPAVSTSTAHGYQNMSYTQLLHDHHQQQQDYIPGAAHVAVPPLVPIGTDNQIIHDHTINEDHQGHLLQEHAFDQLFDPQDEEQQQLVMLLYDQEQPAPLLAPSVSEWEGHVFDDRGGGDGSSSSSYHDHQHQILDNNHNDQILLVDLLANMEPLPPVILPINNSMVDQEQFCSENKDISSLFSNMSPMRMQEEEHRVMINNGEEIRSDNLDYSTTIADGFDDLEYGYAGIVNFDDHGQNNYMNALTDDVVLDTGEYNTFWENYWEYPPQPPPPLPPPSHNQAATAGS